MRNKKNKAQPRVVVLEESESGRNLKFLDTLTREVMNIRQFNKKIDENIDGLGKLYYNRYIHGLQTPVSKPDKSKSNNLG